MSFLTERTKTIIAGIGGFFAIAASVAINNMERPSVPERELSLQEQYGVSFDGERACLVITEEGSESSLLCRRDGFTESGLYLMNRYARSNNGKISNQKSEVEYHPR